MKFHSLQKPFFFTIAFLTIGVVIATLVYTQAQKRPESSLVNGIMEMNKVSKELQPGIDAEVQISEGSLSEYEPGSFILILPADAVNEKYTIELSFRDPSILETAGKTGWRHINIVNVQLKDIHQNSVDDVEFPVPVEACFLLNDPLMAKYAENPDSLRVEHFNDKISPARWQVLSPTTHISRRLLCGQTTSLSLFALAENMTGPDTIPLTGQTDPYSP